jgi:opine dehydrogenase
MKIAILGGGNAGFTTGAFFRHLGHEVNIYKRSLGEDISFHNFEIESIGKDCFNTTIDLVSGSIEKVLQGSEIVFISVPGYCQDLFFEDYIPLLNPDIFTVLMPDNYGSFFLNHKINAKVNEKKALQSYNKILSTNSIPFACRKLDSRIVSIKGIKDEIKVSSIYPHQIDEGLKILQNIHSGFVKGEHIFEICLSNMNPVVHAAVTLLNIGWIERTGGQFDFYADGITPAVARVIGQIDNERIQIGRQLGVELDSLLINMQKIYRVSADNLYTALSQSSIHSSDFAPVSLDTRYINEDIPYGLMPLSMLGKMTGIKTEAIDTIIELGAIASGKTFHNDFLPYFKKFVITFLDNRL